MSCGLEVKFRLCDVGKLGDLSGPFPFTSIMEIPVVPASQDCWRINERGGHKLDVQGTYS